MTLANKTIGNALAGVIGYVWPVVLAILTTPYIVHKLGNDVYGILALVTSILGFFAFLDLGVTNAAIKYIAESSAKNDVEGINKIIGSSLSVFLAIGVMVGALIAIMTSTLVQKFLKIPVVYVSDSTFAFYVAACGFALNMIVGVFAAIPKAIQRYDLATKVNILIGTSVTLSIVLIVYLGYGLKQVVILNFLSSLISLAAYIIIAKKHVEGISIKIHFDPVTFNKLFRFGMYSLIVVASSTVCYQLDRLLIGSFLGSASVAFYVIPASIAVGMHSFDISLMGVVFPLCSQLFAAREYDKLRELYLKASKYAFIIIISLAVPVSVLSKQIMVQWMGADYGLESSVVLAILTLTAVFNSLTTIPYFILDGTGLPRVNAKFAIISAVLNIGLCLLLIPRLRLVGAAIANLSNVLVVILYIITIDRKIMHIGIKRIARDIWLGPSFVGLMEAMILYFLFLPLIRGRLSLLLVILGAMGSYYLALRVFNILNAEDKQIFEQYISLKLKELF